MVMFIWTMLNKFMWKDKINENSESETELLEKKTNLKNNLALALDENIETPKASFSSTRWWSEEKDYEYILTHAQPTDGWLWYRENLLKWLTEYQKEWFVWILREAIELKDDELIRFVIKSLFRYLWIQMLTWLTNQEIDQVVNSLDSFKSPFIVPVEKLWDSSDYLMNQSTWVTNAFKDLALQQVTTMLSVITKRNNLASFEKAIDDKSKWISYKFKTVDWKEKLVKYENWKIAEEQGNRPKLTFVVTQTSTSWDTWPAWMAWIEGNPFALNVVCYPHNQATRAQALQMEEGRWDNVTAIAVKEAFTRIQEKMKECNTPEFKWELQEIIEKKFRSLRKKYWFDIEVTSWSFNSVNQARIDAQSIYQFATSLIWEAIYPDKIKWKETKITPTGNFWHWLWSIYANTGWDIVLSTNDNDAIYNLIKNWRYVMATSEVDSPSVSMIIRYWSNVERLIRMISSSERCRELMTKFEGDWKILEIWEKYLNTNEPNLPKFIEETKKLSIYKDVDVSLRRLLALVEDHPDNIEEIKNTYNYFKTNDAWFKLTEEEHQKIKDLKINSYKVSITDELQTIRNTWLKYNRLICPHTANALCTSQKYRDDPENEDKKNNPILISETASPWKFLASIATALTCEDQSKMEWEYRELRKFETSKKWVEKLLKIIKKAYKDNWIKFDESIIPDNLARIYESSFEVDKVVSADEFGQKTLDFTEKYAHNFVNQVEDLPGEKLIEYMNKYLNYWVKNNDFRALYDRSKLGFIEEVENMLKLPEVISNQEDKNKIKLLLNEVRNIFNLDSWELEIEDL